MDQGSTDEHWDAVYRTRAATEVSWYQGRPSISLELIELLDVTPESPVVDIGAGPTAGSVRRTPATAGSLFRWTSTNGEW